MIALPPILRLARRAARLAVGLAALASAAAMLASAGLGARSHGRVDAATFCWSDSHTSRQYLVGSSDGRAFVRAYWPVVDRPDPGEVPFPVFWHVKVNPDVTLVEPGTGHGTFGGGGLFGDPPAIPPVLVPVYGRADYQPAADARRAEAAGRAGFGWRAVKEVTRGDRRNLFGQDDGGSAKPYEYVSRLRVAVAPWWAVTAAAAVLPAAWMAARVRRGRSAAGERPTVPARGGADGPALARWARRAARVSAAGAALVLAVWAWSFWTEDYVNVSAGGTAAHLWSYDGGLDVNVGPPRWHSEGDADPSWANWESHSNAGQRCIVMSDGLTLARHEVGRNSGGVPEELPPDHDSDAPSPGDAVPYDPPRHQYHVTIPYLWPAGALAVWPLAAGLSWAARRRRGVAGACADCGYDLRATPDRCPECGRPPRGASTGRSALTPAFAPVLAAASLLMLVGLAGSLLLPPSGYGGGRRWASWDGAGDDWHLESESGRLWLRPYDRSGNGPFGSGRIGGGLFGNEDVKRREERRAESGGFALVRWVDVAELDPPESAYDEWTDAQLAAWEADPPVRVAPRAWAAAVPLWAVGLAMAATPAAWGRRALKRRG